MAANADVFFSASLFAGVSVCSAEAEIKAEASVPHSVSQLKNSAPSQQAHINGNHLHFPAARIDTSKSPEDTSEEDEDLSGDGEEDEEEDEMEEAPTKWQGIEAIFEAYQKYADGESSLDLNIVRWFLTDCRLIWCLLWLYFYLPRMEFREAGSSQSVQKT